MEKLCDSVVGISIVRPLQRVEVVARVVGKRTLSSLREYPPYQILLLADFVDTACIVFITKEGMKNVVDPEKLESSFVELMEAVDQLRECVPPFHEADSTGIPMQ